MLYFVAGDMSLAQILADLYGILLEVRMGVVRGLITKENGDVLLQEYQLLAERLDGGASPVLGLSAQDFIVEAVPATEAPRTLTASSFPHAYTKKDTLRESAKHVKDIALGSPTVSLDMGASRTDRILLFMAKNSPASIKDIAHFVGGCSEKTIQRDLGVLIERGVVQRTGERRWSQYSLR